MNRPARFTVADARRAGLAAKQLGPEWRVEIRPDGTITLARGDGAHVAPPTAPEHPPEPVEDEITILF